MIKKIFAISTLVFVLLTGVIFVYNYAFKKSDPKIETPKIADEGKLESSLSNTTKTKGDGKPETNSLITAISDESVFGAVLAPDGKTIYCFAEENGQLNQIDFAGKLEKVISTEEIRNIQKAFWNKPRNKVAVRQSGDSGSSKFISLNLSQKTAVPLKEGVDSVSWSGLGDRMIYKYFDPDTRKRTLNIANPDGSDWKKIIDIDFFGVSISPVPGSSDVSFWPFPEAFTASSVNIVSYSGENKGELLKGRFGADLLWSPDGKTAAVSYTDQKGGHKTDLALMNFDGGEFRSLNFPTFVKKCAWTDNSKYLFCAMPGNVPEAAILPNDWQEGKIYTSDTFWKIKIATGEKERLIETENINGAFDALDPFLSQDEKNLFFTNKADGKLYKMEL